MKKCVQAQRGTTKWPWSSMIRRKSTFTTFWRPFGNATTQHRSTARATIVEHSTSRLPALTDAFVVFGVVVVCCCCFCVGLFALTNPQHNTHLFIYAIIITKILKRQGIGQVFTAQRRNNISWQWKLLSCTRRYHIGIGCMHHAWMYVMWIKLFAVFHLFVVLCCGGRSK